jgi:serine protease
MAAAVRQGTWNYYYIDLPGGSKNLLIDLYNLTADLDLYVKQGSKPTQSSYDCRPWLLGATGELCSFASPASGRWWIGILNWDTGSIFYKIRASWSEGQSKGLPWLLLLLGN